MFDLDGFKSINDRYGHYVGDEVLISFSALATSHLRPNDLFARIGGEEFATLLQNTTRQGAFALAERVRTAVEAASHLRRQHAIRVTVSGGIALSNDATADLADLLKAADDALYRAKEAGRNRVAVSTCAAECVPLRRSDRLPTQKRSAA